MFTNTPISITRSNPYSSEITRSGSSTTNTITTTITTTTRTPPGGGPPVLGGSGSSRPYLGGGFTKWQRDNPVADIAYLSKGLGGSGKATKKSKRKSKDPFGGSPF
jgi:hypothetical protein